MKNWRLPEPTRWVLAIRHARDVHRFQRVGAASAQQDEELAIAGANALESMDITSMANGQDPLPVTYIESQKVAASFQRGAVLVGEDETMMHTARNYMV